VGAQIETVLLYRETLERAKLQHEMDLAARVQLALLPRRLPRVAGLDLYAHSRPAMQVGGDFYDLVAQPNRPFLFSVGDVSGKGIAAAFFMSMLRTLIRSVAKSVSAMTPELVLARSAQDMYDDFNDVGMFATVFVGQYEPAQRRLTYANAGHSPVIYCPAGRPAQLLPADDVPVGILPLDQPQSRSLTLQPGDALVVASDGFSEARDLNGVMFGYDRLLQHVQAQIHAGKTARETTLALFERLSDYGAGCPQDDDQTLVVLKGVPA
jgi:sigma-B regulation protein RsbU (phosphoserine phosphatase)